LPGWLQKTRETLSQTASASDIVRQFARLAASYGDSRIATPEQRALLLREWQEAFGHHAPEHLHQAVSMALKDCKFWPTIAEINEHVTHIRREAIAAVDVATGRTRYQAKTQGFAREGRTDAEEIAHRAAQVLKWKQEYGFNRMLQSDEPAAKAKPASQDTTISDALKATESYRRIKTREGG